MSSNPFEPSAVANSNVPGITKKPQVIDRVVARTGLKKRDVKPAVEAAMAVLAEALIDGDELNLPPLGKIRVVKTKETGSGAQVLTLKLRTMKPNTNPAHSGLASSDDAD